MVDVDVCVACPITDNGQGLVEAPAGIDRDAAAHVVAEKEVVGVWGEPTILKKSQ